MSSASRFFVEVTFDTAPVFGTRAAPGTLIVVFKLLEQMPTPQVATQAADQQDALRLMVETQRRQMDAMNAQIQALIARSYSDTTPKTSAATSNDLVTKEAARIRELVRDYTATVIDPENVPNRDAPPNEDTSADGDSPIDVRGLKGDET